MPGREPKRFVTFIRPDGQSFGNAYLDECEPWVQTRIQVSNIGQDLWDLYQSNPEAWEGDPPPPPIPTQPIETWAFHNGNIEPTLYRSPKSEWFRRLWPDEYARGGLEIYKRRYIGLTEEQAHEWLQFNGYDLPNSVQNGAPSDFYDEDADILPTKGESLTVAEFERLLFDVEQLHDRAGYKGREWGGVYPPGIRRAIFRREAIMNQAPGFADLKAYLNIELGQWVTKKAVEEFVRCLSRKLRKPFDEVGQLSLEEALVALNESSAPSVAATKAQEGSAIASAQTNGRNQAVPIDFAAVVSELRKAGKVVQAALVEYMIDKTEATAENIAVHVHGDSETSEGAMRNNANRTSGSLVDLGVRLSFRLASGRMFRMISPE